jgi:hypothetical protein
VAQCGAIKADGGRCKNLAAKGSEWCSSHDPAYAERRKRAARKGGKSKGGGAELVELKKHLSTLASAVLSGSVDRADAAVVGQLFNVKLRAIEQERKLREIEDLEHRLEELEESLADQSQRRGRTA